MTQTIPLRNDPKKVAMASMIGTAIEFYDYYIYVTQVVLVFNTQFFDKSDPAAAYPIFAIDFGVGVYRSPCRFGVVWAFW